MANVFRTSDFPFVPTNLYSTESSRRRPVSHVWCVDCDALSQNANMEFFTRPELMCILEMLSESNQAQREQLGGSRADASHILIGWYTCFCQSQEDRAVRDEKRNAVVFMDQVWEPLAQMIYLTTDWLQNTFRETVEKGLKRWKFVFASIESFPPINPFHSLARVMCGRRRFVSEPECEILNLTRACQKPFCPIGFPQSCQALLVRWQTWGVIMYPVCVGGLPASINHFS